jgi:MFS family permease
MPFIREKLEIGYTAASLHFSAFALGGVVSGLTGDRVVARIGRRRALWFGMTGMALGVASLAASPTIAGTILGAFATGAVGTYALMANQSALSDLHRDLRSIALAESNVAASSAAIVAPLAVGGLDAAGVGWQTALLIGLPLLAVLFWRFRSVPIPERAPATESAHGSAPLPRRFWIFWAVLFMGSAVEWCMAFWGADFLDSVAGLRKSSAATAMSIFFAAMVAGRALGARMTRRRSGPALLLAAFAVALVGFPIFWLSPNAYVSLAGLFVAGVGIANFYPLAIAAATDSAPDQPDQATARLAIAGGSALLIVPLIVGAISDAVGMRWGFGIVVPLLIGALAATTVARRR